MARPRKRHLQLELPKLDKNGQRRGGRRAGAGRPRNDGTKGGRKRAAHRRRAQVKPSHPQHVVLRTVSGIWLRGPKTYRAIRRALAVVLDGHAGFRVVHFSLQSDHVHLLCEAENKAALASGVRAFEISAAKHLNRELTRRGAARRRGQVFVDRYHVESITTVAGTRHALNYVLNNWRKHHQDRAAVGLYDGRIDPFSSGVWFMGWKERTEPFVTVPPDYEAPRVSQPRSWLLARGYKLGPPISCFAVPGPRRAARPS